MTKNSYLPVEVKIIKIEQQSPTIKLIRIKKTKGLFPRNSLGMTFIPGQFVMLGLWGYGEAPFDPASSPFEDKFLDMLIANVGTLTSAIHKLKTGDKLTLRGPYGNGYPLEVLRGSAGKDLLMIAGGYAIASIGALAEYLLIHRQKFNNLYLLYGASDPQNILFKNQLKKWGKKIKVLLTVDKPLPGWKGSVGLVSELIKEVKINPSNTVAIMAGPDVMMKALEKILIPLGVSSHKIYFNQTRKMQCGVGKCQHCVIGDKYVCKDGPVFCCDEINKYWD